MALPRRSAMIRRVSGLPLWLAPTKSAGRGARAITLPAPSMMPTAPPAGRVAPTTGVKEARSTTAWTAPTGTPAASRSG